MALVNMTAVNTSSSRGSTRNFTSSSVVAPYTSVLSHPGTNTSATGASSRSSSYPGIFTNISSRSRAVCDITPPSDCNGQGTLQGCMCICNSGYANDLSVSMTARTSCSHTLYTSSSCWFISQLKQLTTTLLLAHLANPRHTSVLTFNTTDSNHLLLPLRSVCPFISPLPLSSPSELPCPPVVCVHRQQFW